MFYPAMLNSSVTTSAVEVSARQARKEVEMAKHDIDRLLLITEALWTLLKQEHGYEDNILTKLIAEIDQRHCGLDGAKDPPVQCPSCGRTNSAKRSLCIFCATTLLTSPSPFTR